MPEAVSVLITLAVYGGISYLVGLAARNMMGRSLLGWMILALVFSPVVAFVFLLVAGRPMNPAEELELDRTQKEERDRAQAERQGQHDCPSCGQEINLATRQGVKASEEEPWRISCAYCSVELDAARL